MSVTVSARRPPVAARRVGYLIAAAINTALLYLVNGWPGWQAVPFLTDQTARVLVLVNLTFVANAAVNLCYVAYDPRWLKALGDLLTAALGLAAVVWVLRVFPFDFTGYGFDWAIVARFALILGIVGTSIGVLVQSVSLIWLLVAASTQGPPARGVR